MHLFVKCIFPIKGHLENGLNYSMTLTYKQELYKRGNVCVF